jgi:hypothetical protein
MLLRDSGVWHLLSIVSKIFLLHYDSTERYNPYQVVPSHHQILLSSSPITFHFPTCPHYTFSMNHKYIQTELEIKPKTHQILEQYMQQNPN